jgi:hypothetical protein
MPCWASEPASARTKIIGRNRPKAIAKPNAVFHQTVLPERPANADPLLLAAEVNA